MTASNSPWLGALAARPRRAALLFYVLAVLLALVPVGLSYKYGWEYLTVSIWAGTLAAIMLGAGLWLTSRESGSPIGVDAARLLVLTVGGLSGLLTWYLSLTLFWKWWTPITGGFEAWQGADWWQIWVFLTAQLVGLGVMFASLLLARAEERSNPVLRRLLYGYNAALTGLLLFEVLLVLNVLVFVNAPAAQDWTASRFYTLSPQSENVLKSLKQPVKVYVLLPSADRLYTEVQTLMDNSRNVSNKLQIDYLSPDKEIRRFRELKLDFPLVERGDLLLVQGSGPEAVHQIVKRKDLETVEGGRPMMPRGDEKSLFKGEDAFLSALKALSDHKPKILYFTQGNGELDLTDAEATPPERRGGSLKKRLEQEGYQVKRLQLTALTGAKTGGAELVVADKVPADATVVVAAGPNKPLPAGAVKALDEYMGPARKGKLVALLDVVVGPDGKMVQTGLEGLLERFNVKAEDDRLLRVPQGPPYDPERIVALTNPQVRNPVALAFLTPRPAGFVLERVRTVRPNAPSGPARSTLDAETLMISVPSDYVWSETNLTANPEFLVNALVKDPKVQEAKLTKQFHSLAVAVSERSQAADPHNPLAPPPEAEARPRLVAFGTSSLASNLRMEESQNNFDYPLFASVLSWLRERPESIGVGAKKYDNYKLGPNTDFNLLLLLPAGLLFVGIIGLGTGVWLVRRGV